MFLKKIIVKQEKDDFLIFVDICIIACFLHPFPLQKKEVVVSRSRLEQEVRASQDITAAKLLRYFTPM